METTQDLLANPWARYIIAAGLVGVSLYLWDKLSQSAPKQAIKYGVPHTEATNDSSVVTRSRWSPKKLITNMEGISTLHDFLAATVKRHGADREFSGTRPLIQVFEETKSVNGQPRKMQYYHLGDYEWITYGQYQQSIADFSSGLAALGLKKGGKLALFEETRNEWTVAAQAAFRLSSSILTVYANLGEEALAHALDIGEVEFLVANGTTLATVLNIATKVMTLKTVIFLDKADERAKSALSEKKIEVISFADVIELGKQKPVEEVPPKPDDVAVIMFTSGTTGLPKGVVLTHGQVVSALAAGFTLLGSAVNLDSNDVYLSYLPLAHILAFVVHYVVFYAGARVGYGSTRTVGATFMRNCDGDIKTLRPTVFVGVPTVLEKIKKEVERKVAASGAFTRGLFKWAFNRKVAARAQGQSTPILDKIIFNKFKQLVGGRCRLMVSGGAYLSPAVQTFMETCFSTKVAQGYGLTETCGPACFQEPTDTRIGSIGAPFPSVEVKLVDVPEMGYTHLDKPQPRGELWIRGNSVASGYYKNEEESKKAITPDGWFKTGDVGELTPDGTFIIIDRVKNLVKPPHGEYIAVERLESIYRDLSCVEQILVYADNHHNEVVAIVVPQHAAVVKFAEANKIAGDDFGHLVREPAVKKWILKALQDTGRQKGLKSIETVRSVFVTSDEWTPENDLLTAANKVKRQLIVKKYKQEIDAMYEELSRADE